MDARFLTALAVLLVACDGHSPTTFERSLLPTGTVAVTVSVTGPGDDSDGFLLSIDGVEVGGVPPGTPASFDQVVVGSRRVKIGGVAKHCALDGPPAVAVTVPQGGTVPVQFPVDCDYRRGALTLEVQSTGWRHDGYSAVLASPDTAFEISLPWEGDTRVDAIPAGTYRVTPSAPATCAGPRTRAIVVEADSETKVGLEFACEPPTGHLRIDVVTEGDHPDADGYTLHVEGVGAVPLPTQGAVELADVLAGTWGLSMSGVASHCSVVSLPETVRIDTGQTAEVEVRVRCAWPSPTLLAPVGGAVIAQNDPSIPCSDHPTRGRGYMVRFAWTAVSHPSGVAYYEVIAQRAGAAAASVDVQVRGEEYVALRCNTFVIDENLTDWGWRVRAIANDGEEGPWTGLGEYRFQPCRLSDGTPCHAFD